MSRSTLNFLVDMTLATLFGAVLAATSIAEFVFPPGLDSQGWSLWGLEIDGWRSVQVAAIGLFSLGVLLHLILHWNWICGFLTARLSRRWGMRVKINDSEKTVYGVATLILFLSILGMVVTAAEFSAKPPADAAKNDQAPAKKSVLQEETQPPRPVEN